jgi:hypothetical protein
MSRFGRGHHAWWSYGSSSEGIRILYDFVRIPIIKRKSPAECAGPFWLMV